MRTFQLADGEELKLLPFTIEVAERVLELSDQATKDESLLAQVKVLTKMCAFGLARGNPVVTELWLKQHVELKELGLLYRAMMEASGGSQVPPGEAASP